MDSPRKFVTYYDILGVKNDAPTDEIRKAYRKRVLETHPDKLEVVASEEEKQAAEREFHKVHEAFQTLGDAQKRRRYDALRALRTDPALVSEYSAKRTEDRHEWARQQEEMAQRRIDAFKKEMQVERVQAEERRKRERETRKKVEEERAQQQLKQIADTLREMVNANSDFAARREAVLKRRAERECLEKEQLRALSAPPPTPLLPDPPKSPTTSVSS